MICSVCHEEKDWGTGHLDVCHDCYQNGGIPRSDKTIFKCTKQVRIVNE